MNFAERVAFGKNPLSLAALDSSPEGRALGKEGESRPHLSTAGRSQPLSCKLYAFAKGSPLGRAGERSEPERVRTESDPLRQRLLALPPPPRGEALAKTEGIALTS